MSRFALYLRGEGDVHPMSVEPGASTSRAFGADGGLRNRCDAYAVHVMALDEPRDESRRFRLFDEGG